MVAQNVQDAGCRREGRLGQRHVDEHRWDGVERSFVPVCERRGIEQGRNRTESGRTRAYGSARIVLDAATNGNV